MDESLTYTTLFRSRECERFDLYLAGLGRHPLARVGGYNDAAGAGMRLLYNIR